MSIVLFLAVVASSHPGLEATILGDWCAGSKYAFHEVFSLEVGQDGHAFHSWLHQRPDLDGSWTLTDRTLTIRGSNGDTMVYQILSATKRRLVMREKDEKHSETYVRLGKCRSFGGPLP